MGYWKRRILNLILQAVTLKQYFYRYSQHYSLEKKKLVSKKDDSFLNWNAVSFGLRKPKKHDRLDYKFWQERNYKVTAIPTKLDLRTYLKSYKVRDQGNQGSCTGQTTAEDQDLKEIIAGVWKEQTSAAMAYYEIRKLHGWQNEDSGGNMVDEGTVLGNTGVCLNKTMPYKDSSYTTAPSTAAYTEAKDHRHEKTQTLLRVAEIKAAMAQYNSPVRIGVPIPQSFFASQFGGWVPLKYDTIQGYHSMLIVGYDDDLTNPTTKVKGHFIVLNSWGSFYGASGYVYIPYEWMTYYEKQGELDIWIQPKLLNVTPPPPPPTKNVYIRVQSSVDEQNWKTLWEGKVT